MVYIGVDLHRKKSRVAARGRRVIRIVYNLGNG